MSKPTPKRFSYTLHTKAGAAAFADSMRGQPDASAVQISADGLTVWWTQTTTD